MENRQVSLVSFLDAVYPLAADAAPRAVTIHRNRTEEIVRRVQAECWKTGRVFGEDFMISRWMAYNSVNGYVQHVQRANKLGRMDQVLASLEDANVDKAESLAMAV